MKQSDVVRDFPPRIRPMQTSDERLARMESKVTKLAMALGVDTSGPTEPTDRIALVVDEDGIETLDATHLQVTVMDLYEAAHRLEMEFPVTVSVQGKLIGFLHQLRTPTQPHAAA